MMILAKCFYEFSLVFTTRFCKGLDKYSENLTNPKNMQGVCNFLPFKITILGQQI